jgi:hypothetical protein
MIKREGPRKFVLYSRDGSRKLGTYASRKAAEERERQINAIKAIKAKKG